MQKHTANMIENTIHKLIIAAAICFLFYTCTDGSHQKGTDKECAEEISQ